MILASLLPESVTDTMTTPASTCFLCVCTHTTTTTWENSQLKIRWFYPKFWLFLLSCISISVVIHKRAIGTVRTVRGAESMKWYSVRPSVPVRENSSKPTAVGLLLWAQQAGDIDRLLQQCLPSVLWRCWLGGRKGIRSVKNWVVGCWRGYLTGARCRLAYGPADATATHYLLLQ